MPKKIDLTGQRFGSLLVIKQAPNIITPNKRSHVAWECQCDCGNKIIVRSDCLRNGHTISCGCRKKEVLLSAGHNRIIDLVGQRFGYLTVIESTSQRSSKGEVKWKCQCDCGNIIYVTSSNLRREKGGTISCGCKKSKGEERITQILLNLQVPFIIQKKFDDCIFPETGRHLIFDFFLPEQNLLIEYDGIQHFQPVKNDRYDFLNLQKRDNYKNQWCLEHNIKLVRIPYNDFDFLNEDYMKAIIDHNGWRLIK